MSFKAQDWTDFLLAEGVLKFGDFTLKDGSKSPFFLDFGALSRGSSFRRVGAFLASFLEDKVGFEKVDFLYGPPYKAVMLAGATAMACEKKDVGCYFSRKEAKAHGEGGKSFGYLPEPGEAYVLLDDVMSSGGTKLEALEHLKDCRCLGVVVGVDREHLTAENRTAAQAFTEETGVPVYGLVGLKELCGHLEGKIAAERYAEMRNFCGLS